MTKCAIATPDHEPKPEPLKSLQKPGATEVLAYVNSIIGKVPNFVMTKVVNIWAYRWRVNVYVTESAGECGLVSNNRIKHSFFIVTTKDHKIIKCIADKGR